MHFLHNTIITNEFKWQMLQDVDVSDEVSQKELTNESHLFELCEIVSVSKCLICRFFVDFGIDFPFL